MNRAQAERHVREAFAVWEHRSALTWRVDLSMIAALGVTTRR